MRVLEDLIAACGDAPVAALRVGVFDTLVESLVCGLASTLRPARCGASDGGRALDAVGKSVRGLLPLALSEDLLEASIGMAAINSALPQPAVWGPDINGRDLILEKGQGRRAALIGHFPFLVKIKNEFKELLVFEKEPQPGDLPEAAIPERLAEADVVGLTATTLTNHTFHEVMAHIRPDAFVVMLGPTTPLSPVLFDYGVDVVCGARVTDAERVRHHVECALPFRKIPGVVRASLQKEAIDG